MSSRACFTLLARRRAQMYAHEHVRALVPTSERCIVDVASPRVSPEQLTRHLWTTSTPAPVSSIARARDERVENTLTCATRALDSARRSYSKKKKGKGGKKDTAAVGADDVSSDEDDGSEDDGEDGDGAIEYDPKVWQSKFEGATHALTEDLAQLRTSRASAGMIDHIMVDVYGESTPLSQLATITAPNAQTLSVTLYDASTASAVEKAIMNSPLGLVPRSSSDGMIVPIPTMTQDTRKEVSKLASKLAENAKIAARNIRHRALKHIKRAAMPEDDQKRAEKHLQSMTDDTIAVITKLCAAKDKEIMSL